MNHFIYTTIYILNLFNFKENHKRDYKANTELDNLCLNLQLLLNINFIFINKLDLIYLIITKKIIAFLKLLFISMNHLKILEQIKKIIFTMRDLKFYFILLGINLS